MVLLPWIPVLIRGLVSQTGALFIPLSKVQHENFAATQVPKRERTRIPEKRKYNFYKTSVHFFGIEKFEPKILQISVFKIYGKINFVGMERKKEERLQNSLSLGLIPTFVIILWFHVKQELFSPTAAFLI